MSRYSTTLANFWHSIVLFAALGLFLGVVLSFLRPLEYSSTTRLLILQQIGAVDAYTASRAAERVADDLANIIYTTTFYGKVISASSNIDQEYFGDNEHRLRKKWGRTVDATVARGTGLLEINVYHTDVEQAELIARAVTAVLVSEGWTFTSGGSISIQQVDDPLNSRWPMRPNIPVNAFTGFFLGGLAGIGYVFLKADRIRRRHQLLHE
ncbi:MAG: hypothetical protein AAB337_03530 [Patescibacteria group bacterium]